MSGDQLTVLGILATTVGLFLWGRWRHDVVALGALLASVLAGLVPGAEAFAGFGHPAVITVAAVLVLSEGLQRTGAVDALAQRTVPARAGPTLTIATLTALGAVLSAFMNNVGAMALLMPVALQVAAKHEITPGKVLMPLAFGTILGGMTTLIGTPPNLIVSGFRAEAGLGGFRMFDFSPVGLAVAVAGVAFVALVGWRIVPRRERGGAGGFDTGKYLTEARVMDDGKAVGRALHEVEEALEDADAQVVGLVRSAFRVSAPYASRRLRAGDILVIEAEPESLAAVLSGLGLALEENVPPKPEPQASTGEADVGAVADAEEDAGRERGAERREADDIVLQEVAVLPTSALLGRSARDLHLRTRFGLNLLAISRQGRQSIQRLRSTPVRAGDLLLLQGAPDSLAGFAAAFGCVPLAARQIHLPDTRQAAIAAGVMALAILVAALGLLPAAVSFAVGVLVFMVLRVVPPRRAYEAVDWPVVVLLAGLIPVAGAMASTGAADVLAQTLLQGIAQGNPVVALTLLLVVTMTLSDFMNNAATAAVMCPIALSSAQQLGASPDAFLMAVAIGASCAFLTPIGHQNNTLILGPGGLRFGDFWRLGLPMEVLVVLVAVPMLLWVWPL
ncbi:MAG: anion permease [Ectothiorhodospiraceae bacterium]|nr:anion permease [Chromatiales bacterium]MCP5153721.1 anion permease [Ectothiorhodospiraceae bacterium]